MLIDDFNIIDSGVTATVGASFISLKRIIVPDAATTPVPRDNVTQHIYADGWPICWEFRLEFPNGAPTTGDIELRLLAGATSGSVAIRRIDRILPRREMVHRITLDWNTAFDDAGYVYWANGWQNNLDVPCKLTTRIVPATFVMDSRGRSVGFKVDGL